MDNITVSDFRKLDLNLLLVFHALSAERSVTRAARRLFIGQPALSGALKRLRIAFDDQLFVRTSHGMEPTARALELRRVIDPLLASLQEALHGSPCFDPMSVQRTFHVGLSDALEVALLPVVMRRLASAAPGVRLVSHVTDGARASGMLDDGTIGLAVGVFLEAPAWQRRKALFEWSFVCVFDPLQVRIRGRKLSMSQYLRHPHVLTSFNSQTSGLVDELLAKQGLQRRVILSSRHFSTSPLIARQMGALTTVPSFVAEAWREALGLAVATLPFEMPTYEVSLMWSQVNDSDAGLKWLSGIFDEAFGSPRRNRSAPGPVH